MTLRRLFLLGATAGVLVIAFGGCTTPIGLIYSDITTPQDTNLQGERIDLRKGHQRGQGDVRHFRYYLEVDWGENGIGTIAKELGWEKIDYADLREVRVLWYWRQEYVDLYGRGPEAAAPPRREEEVTSLSN